MEKLLINKDNLQINDIDEEIIRSKGLIINSDKELLLVFNGNTFQFPGGHVQSGETPNDTLKREIKEETGIDIEAKGKPFMLIEEYYKNYLSTGINRCNKIYYYAVECDNYPNYEEIELTDLEKQTDFRLIYVNLYEFDEFLKEAKEENLIHNVIADEIEQTIIAYKKLLKEEII